MRRHSAYFCASLELACDGNEVGFAEGGDAILSDIREVAWGVEVGVEELGACLVCLRLLSRQLVCLVR